MESVLVLRLCEGRVLHFGDNGYEIVLQLETRKMNRYVIIFFSVLLSSFWFFTC